jgi:hypothetical protein
LKQSYTIHPASFRPSVLQTNAHYFELFFLMWFRILGFVLRKKFK